MRLGLGLGSADSSEWSPVLCSSARPQPSRVVPGQEPRPTVSGVAVEGGKGWGDEERTEKMRWRRRGYLVYVVLLRSQILC